MKTLVVILSALTWCEAKREKRGIQNCAGSQCSQSNLNLSPSPFYPGHGQGFGFGGFGFGAPGFGGGFSGGQTQNCLGSQCQQSNQNVGHPGLGLGFGGQQTQNCLGSQCQQNNLAFGKRRKRSTEERYLSSSSVGNKRNLTVRKIGSSATKTPAKRRKYTSRVVETERTPSYQETEFRSAPAAATAPSEHSGIISLLTSDTFLDFVINKKYQ